MSAQLYHQTAVAQSSLFEGNVGEEGKERELKCQTVGNWSFANPVIAGFT